MNRINRIIIWVLGLSFLTFLIFLPIDIYRKKSEKVSPQIPQVPAIKPGEIFNFTTTATPTSSENY